jgi:hypothetical protein
MAMDETLAGPRLTDEGVYFSVAADGAQRECLVSRNALTYLCRLQGHSMSFMNTYRSCEARIQAVARRLVAAGESASPLILGAAYFVEGDSRPGV